MPVFLIIFSLLSAPAAPRWPSTWRVALSRGPLPVLQDGRVITAPDSFIKWVIADRCVISLAGETAVIFTAGTGSSCPRAHLVTGKIRIAAPAEHPVELTWDGGSRSVSGVVTVTLVKGRVRFDGPGPVEPGVVEDVFGSVQPVWQLQTRIHQLLKETFSRSNDTLVQTSSTGSMCLDSSGSAGDVGNNQTGITQMPPAAKLQIHVPYPRQVNR